MKRLGLSVLFIFVILAANQGAAQARSAKEILEASGVKGGLVVHLGCGDGSLTAGLKPSDRYKVQGLDSDASNIAKARKHLEASGLYGGVTVSQWSGTRLPYSNNLVNLLVAEKLGDLPMDEVMRVLAPLGVAWIGGKKTVKPWPKEMGQWTHWLHGPDNNAVSEDDMKVIPRSMQWIQKPLWQQSHELTPPFSAMVTAKGRIFYIINDSAPGIAGMPDKWFLIANDAFNGIELWRKPVEDWGGKAWERNISAGHMYSGPLQARRRLVALDDHVYVTLGVNAPVSVLNAATGELVREYKGTETAFEILCKDNLLLLAVNHSLNANNGVPDVSIMAVKRDSGEILWESKGFRGLKSKPNLKGSYVDAMLTMGDKHAFFIDQGDVVALDLQTGKKCWTIERQSTSIETTGKSKSGKGGVMYCTLVYSDNILFFSKIAKTSPNSGAPLIAVDVHTGKKLWEKQMRSVAFANPPDVFINRGLIWGISSNNKDYVGLDPKTGEQKKTLDVTLIMSGTHHNCYRNKATKNFFLYGRNKGLEYFNLDSSEGHRINWTKGSCNYGIMPANGMIYAPSHFCGCFATAKLNGIFALAEHNYKNLKPAGADSVEKGPAYGKDYSSDCEAGKADWPTYRSNNERSGYQACSLPDSLKTKWTVKAGKSITPPVIASGKIFLASKDDHTVLCLDETSGKILWTYKAGGYIDSPPSYEKGRLVFGSREGVIYCLDSESGQLAWRFKAAPGDRQMMAFGRLESAWPAFGSVLLHDGKVFCTAGRSSYLDSGLFLYKLDLNTGAPVASKQLLPKIEVQGEMEGGVNADILVGDDKKISVRGLCVDINTLGIITDRPGSLRIPDFSDVKSQLLLALGGFLDDSMFNSAYWMCAKHSGSMLTLGPDNVYGLKIYGKRSFVKSHRHVNYVPGTDMCKLFNSSKRGSGGGRSSKGNKENAEHSLWTVSLPIRASALVAGSENLYLAGVRDLIDKTDPWGHLDGRKGGLLLVYSAAEGKPKSELSLDAPPVFDGMAAANGRIYISLKNGTVQSFE